MDAKFSPKVKEVISYSREEALRLNHDYIGIEHLLLGLIREGEGLAIKTLARFLRDGFDFEICVILSKNGGFGWSRVEER